MLPQEHANLSITQPQYKLVTRTANYALPLRQKIEIALRNTAYQTYHNTSIT